ncbi:MAG: hypothetical protein J0L97_05655 [Alphaproteobacteria bacterium]|nr:hypothetical protein [Alphaproteobacteria bacterium]
MAEAAQPLDPNEPMVVNLVRGMTVDGQPQYAYVAVRAAINTQFREALATTDCDVQEWGIVLAHGTGENPPPEVMQQMEQQYGVNHNLEHEMYEQMYGKQGEDTNQA